MAVVPWLVALFLAFKMVFVVFGLVFAVGRMIFGVMLRLLGLAVAIFAWNLHSRWTTNREREDGNNVNAREIFRDTLLSTTSGILNRMVSFYQLFTGNSGESPTPRIRLRPCSCQSVGQQSQDQRLYASEQEQLEEAIQRSLQDISLLHNRQAEINQVRNDNEAIEEQRSRQLSVSEAEASCPYPTEDFEYEAMPHPHRYGGHLSFHTDNFPSAPSICSFDVCQTQNRMEHSISSDLYSVD